MFEADKYRDQAAHAHTEADSASTSQERREHRDRARSLDTLADNELWLSENFDKAVHHPGGDRDPAELAAEERHIIQCLGAAMIMHWSTLPAKLQRELFDTAGAMGDLLRTPELRGQIARFLHKYKDGDQAAEPLPGAAPALGELYRSANGDRWLLARDAAGGLFVRHEPNAASGGRPSDVPVNDFLRREGNGPEIQALRRRLASEAPPAP